MGKLVAELSRYRRRGDISMLIIGFHASSVIEADFGRDAKVTKVAKKDESKHRTSFATFESFAPLLKWRWRMGLGNLA